MITISHRVNLEGPTLFENEPWHLEKVLDLGIDVEVDVRIVKDKLFLGHDLPQHEISKNFLLQKGVWCHAKDIFTLHALLEIDAHCFFHDTDDATLTSRGYIWTYPGKYLTPKSIAVLPEKSYLKNIPYAGVCTDYPLVFKDK